VRISYDSRQISTRQFSQGNFHLTRLVKYAKIAARNEYPIFCISFHSTIHSVMCEFWRSSHWVQWSSGGGRGVGTAACGITFVTLSCVVTTDSQQRRHCLARYKGETWGNRLPTVMQMRSSDKWRRQLDAVDRLDWALTRLMWLVHCPNLLGPSNIISHKLVKSREISMP